MIVMLSTVRASALLMDSAHLNRQTMEKRLETMLRAMMIVVLRMFVRRILIAMNTAIMITEIAASVILGIHVLLITSARRMRMRMALLMSMIPQSAPTRTVEDIFVMTQRRVMIRA